MHTASPGDLHPSHEHPTYSSQEHTGEVCCALLGWITSIISNKIFSTSFSLFFSSKPRAAPGSICSVLTSRKRAQDIGNQGKEWGLLTGSAHCTCSAFHGEVPGSSERWEEPPLPQSSCETPELTAPPLLPPCDRLWGFNSGFSALRKAAIKTSQM